jgi:predicted TIM-barrel fold metal-dependent hydrolase
VDKEDVRSTKPFPIKFPLSPDGNLSPAKLILRAECSDSDFKLNSPSTPIMLRPRGDSDPCVFLLTPLREGELIVHLELLQDDSPIGSCLLRTNAVSDGDAVSKKQALVSVPLDLTVQGELEVKAVKYAPPIDQLPQGAEGGGEEEEEEEEEEYVRPAGRLTQGGEEEEEEEEEEVRTVTLNDPLPAALASTVLTEQQATNLASIRKISTHEHYWKGGKIENFIKAMNETGIEKAIFVPTGKPPNNSGYEQNMKELLEIQRRYPHRIVAFATVDEADPDAPAILEEAVKKGAQGLKLIGGHPDFNREALNSVKLQRIIKKCEEFSLPILIHVSMLKHPEMAAQFEHLLTKFPRVTFVAAHYGKFAPELHKMSAMLDRFPNLYTDLSMGGGVATYLAQIHNEPEKFREFIIRHQDRILWGTDIILLADDTTERLRTRIATDLHLLSRRVHVSPFLGDTIPLNGLDLNEKVLNKIFWENPQRVLHIRG